MKIGLCEIAFDQKPYFIADIAANHDGDLQRAYKLIELAKESGANAAKFQNFKAEKIVSDIGFRRMDGQVSHQKEWKKSVFEVYKDASLRDEWTPLLKQRCDEVGIEYMTSPYDFASVDWADSYVNAYKIGSGDITWLEILRYIGQKKKPVILATGAATMAEVEQAVQCISEENTNIALMQCNTNYTATLENYRYINLNVLKTYAQRFPGIPLGLSDHTLGDTTVLGAVALGARIIEKHFTDDRGRSGPDHKFSTTPTEWKEMVLRANDLFMALGDGIKRIEKNELQTCQIQKRGLYATRSLQAGKVLTFEDIEALRPRSDAGYEPYQIKNIIGKMIVKDIQAGEMILKENIKE